MPPLLAASTALLLLTGPVYGILIVLFDTHHRPHHRSILALGGGVLLNVFILTFMAIIGFLIEGNPNPIVSLLVIWAAGVTVYQMMREATLRS